MGQNGISHHVVRDDLEGVKTIIKLLSYAPLEVSLSAIRGGLLNPSSFSSLLHPADPVDRRVSYNPGPGEKLDPRAAIAGE
jgi:acetyl-CoA carboxylase/biotin carboxylase 1